MLGGDARRGDYSYLGAPPRTAPTTNGSNYGQKMASPTNGSNNKQQMAPITAVSLPGAPGNKVTGRVDKATWAREHARPATATPSAHQTRVESKQSVPLARGGSAPSTNNAAQAQPYTLNPEPYTLNPEPCTPNPEP